MGTYAERYGWAMKMARMTAPLRMTMRESPGLKQLEFWRRTISSIRGCCQRPGVEAAGEALCAPEGVVAPFCGVRAETAAFLILLAGDCDCDCPKSCDWDVFEVVRASSDVEDMAVVICGVLLLTGAWCTCGLVESVLSVVGGGGRVGRAPLVFVVARRW
jgi:hypothetical protein